MRYAAGRDQASRALPVAAPLAGRCAAISARRQRPRLAAGFLALREVCGDDLPADPQFARAVTHRLRSLIERGARATVAASIAS